MIPAESFLSTLYMNVDNPRLSDAEFRELVRNTIPIVDFPRPKTDCRYCGFEYDRAMNRCSDTCDATSCPMCSSCQNNEPTPEFIEGALERRDIKLGQQKKLNVQGDYAAYKAASFPSRYGM
jgi:hypothetical protein